MKSIFENTQPHKEGHYGKPNSFKNYPVVAIHGIVVKMYKLVSGRSCCLLYISVARKLQLEPEFAANVLYDFSNQKMPKVISKRSIEFHFESIVVHTKA
ncbi:hypothetical protein NPIL_433211 [Nephila pilipes]|uniref:Uncharacterized protein n=1 Tax=Nephila pilipes TaxID=299642 RepID=A0A8X6U6V4_NEPPI|nr:hypothetical protein NPIL_433211 [Nephila pilipes]